VEHISNEPHNHEPENVVAHSTMAHDHDISSGLDLDILGFSLPDVVVHATVAHDHDISSELDLDILGFFFARSHSLPDIF
jgi:hypothetical protein